MNRKKILEKFKGLCAFCGKSIGKGAHIWDIKPIQSVVNEHGSIEKINTEEENLMPACKECGSLRIKKESGKMDIEAFRNEILEMYLFCRNEATYSSSIRRAIRFGLIIEPAIPPVKNPIVFHFEKKMNDYHITTNEFNNFFTSAENSKKALVNLQTNSRDFVNIIDENKDLNITIKKI